MTFLRSLPVLTALLVGTAASAFAAVLPLPSTSPSTALGWGDNSDGQLGNPTNNGTTRPNPNPLQTTIVASAIAISCGNNHTLALESDGTVWAWGHNYYGQLGNTTNIGSNSDNVTPTQVSGLTNIVAVAGGNNFSLALKNDGTVWAWGINHYGQLGNSTGNGSDTANSTPTQVAGVSGITAIAAGGFHSLALKDDNTVWAWGQNRFGELGDATNAGNTTIATPTPVQSDITGVTAIAAGIYHSAVVTSGGSVYCFGWNIRGQSGIAGTAGTNGPNATPTQVNGISGATKVAAGYYHTVALKNDGTVWAWGLNTYGQLGNATNAGVDASNTTALQVTGLSGVAEIEVGDFDSLARKSDGTVYGWGRNEYGQAGNSTNLNNATAANSTATLSPKLKNITAISGGSFHSAGLTDGVPTAQDGSAVVPNTSSAKVLKLVGTDPQSDPLTYSIVSGPSHGSLSNQTGAYITYTPDASLTSTDSFTFRVNDGSYDSNTATFNLTLNSAPVLVSLIPAKYDDSVVGSGGSSATGDFLKFTLQVTDTEGANAIRVVYLTFNGTLSNGGGMALSYDAVANKLSLRSADGKSIQGSAAPGSAGYIENDYGFLIQQLSTATKVGNKLTVTFVVVPKPGFTGLKKLWANARDTSSAEAGFTEMANWTLKPPAPAATNVQAVDFIELIKPSEVSHTFSLKSVNPDNMPLTYSIVDPPSHGTAVITSGSRVVFTPDGSFAANGTDSFTYKINDGYFDSNTATVTVKYNGAPVLVSLVPGKADDSVIGSGGSSTVGEPLKLVLKVSDEDTADRLRTAYVTFNSTLNNGNGIVVSYDLAGNKLYLRSSDGKTTLGGQAPGSAGTIDNDFGILDFSQSIVEKDVNTLTVTFYVTPKASFTGAKKLWGAVRDTGNLQTGYDQMATWTVNPAVPTLRVKPAANTPSASGS